MFEQKDIDRLWKGLTKVKSGCLEWRKYKNKEGYGQIRIKDKMLYIHRLSWMLHNGKIPEGLCVCHHCDNPKCANIKHLFLGTNSDNMQDKIKKGRDNSPKGEKHGNSILTNSDVLEIVKLLKTLNCRQISERYEVHLSTINRIKLGRRWTHLTGIQYKTG